MTAQLSTPKNKSEFDSVQEQQKSCNRKWAVCGVILIFSVNAIFYYRSPKIPTVSQLIQKNQAQLQLKENYIIPDLANKKAQICKEIDDHTQKKLDQLKESSKELEQQCELTVKELESTKQRLKSSISSQDSERLNVAREYQDTLNNSENGLILNTLTQDHHYQTEKLNTEIAEINYDLQLIKAIEIDICSQRIQQIKTNILKWEAFKHKK